MSNSKLVDKNIPAYKGNYTKNRSKYCKKITEICIHHTAFVTSIETLGRVFQKVGRKGSSHYGIGNDGRIAQFVNESDVAWTNSNWNANCRSVTIETSNSSTGGNWPVSDKALNSLIKLVADIAKRNNLGTLIKGKNITWHRMYSNTTCPGEYLLSKMDYIIEQANKINNGQVVEEWTAGTYKILVSKTLRRKTTLDPSNRCRVGNLDKYTQTLLTSKNKNAIANFKVGVEVPIQEIIKSEGRVWGRYFNTYIVLCNKDGSKQAQKK